MSVSKKIDQFILLVGSIFASLFLSLNVLSTPVFAEPNVNNSTQGNQVQNPSINNSPETQNSVNQNQSVNDSSNNNSNNSPEISNGSSSNGTVTSEHASEAINNSASDQNSSATISNSTSESDSESFNTCYDESGSLGWLVCPSTGFLAKITDSLYNIIESFLIIDPISFDSSSPYHQVWSIFRDITNIIFVIFFLIIIYSQITGAGISNYGIKKALPKIVISAILINLSFILCAILVDLSNIFGASLRGLFLNIETSITATGIVSEAATASSGISYSALAGALTGSAVLTGIAIGAAGGLGYVFFSLLAVLIGAAVSILIAFVTIAARQAIVYLLIMVSPLAFVCFLLPNTESWFDKWKKTLLSMLIFYPLFAALFGACSLVGWVIIAAAETPLTLVFGMAIKVVPLFASWSLLKMSGTLPGQINAALHGFARKPVGSLQSMARNEAALRRAQYTAKQLQKPRTFSGGSLRATLTRQTAHREAALVSAERQTKNLLAEDIMARQEGKTIVGYTSDGAPIYKQRYLGRDENGRKLYSPVVKETKELKSEFTNREIELRNSASKTRLDNSMSTMGNYLESHEITPSLELSARTHRQGENFTELMTQLNAKRRNDIADKRWYANQLRNAAKRDAVTGELINKDAYDRLITRGAGSDAFISSSLAGNELREAETARFAALASVEADAIDALEAERRAITGKYTTYMSKQVTKEVLKAYEQMLESKDIEGICAAQNTLAMRGDYDKIVEHLQEYMDREGYVELGTDFANVLALNLLGMKDADPELARLGKHINVETWAYTDGARNSNYVTYKEFMTGKTSLGEDTKYFVETLMRGTGVKGIDRTFYGGLKSSIDRYLTAENFGSQAEADEARIRLMTEMLPQIISALPTFAAGSEQITNTLNFLTGMTCNSKGEWIIKKPAEDARLKDVYKTMTEQYLRGLTANDLIALKTDTFNALKARFLDLYGSEDAARDKFKEFTEKQCDALRAGDPSALTPMKTKIREYLGL